MMRVFIRGDIHGSTAEVMLQCQSLGLNLDDVLVLLGDVGANYYFNDRDDCVKQDLNSMGPTVLCIHGNHEARPRCMGHAATREWNGGKVFYQPEYPNVLYAIDGSIFSLNGYRCMAIGGAYSVDKYQRIIRGWRWFEDEQPNAQTKQYVEAQLATNRVDVIFSHTCPEKYTPVECFLPGINQESVDRSTEEWLDGIEESVNYKAWYCGHWHINKRIDRIHFLLNEMEVLENI